MISEAKRIKGLIQLMRQIEKDIVMGVTDQLAQADAVYSQQLTELKLVTDNLRTSMWCAYVSKNSPEKVREFVERHRMNRTIEFLRNRTSYAAGEAKDKGLAVSH